MTPGTTSVRVSSSESAASEKFWKRRCASPISAPVSFGSMYPLSVASPRRLRRDRNRFTKVFRPVHITQKLSIDIPHSHRYLRAINSTDDTRRHQSAAAEKERVLKQLICRSAVVATVGALAAIGIAGPVWASG